MIGRICVRRRLQLDPTLLWRRLRAEVAVVLRVGGVLGRCLRGVVGMLAVVGLVWRGRAGWWCHPACSCVWAEAVGAAAAGVETTGRG